MCGGAAATRRYEPPASSGQTSPLNALPLKANANGLNDAGTKIEMISAAPRRNSAFFCRSGSRSFASGTPKIVPGAEPGSARAMLSSGPGRSATGAAYGFAPGGG